MNINEFKVGMRISDSWYGYWGTGTVRKVLKTRVVIGFTNGNVMTYDKQHLQFLYQGVAK